VEHNWISVLPHDFSNLKLLREVNIQDNLLTRPPFQLYNLPSLRRFSFENNPICCSDDPASILLSQDSVHHLELTSQTPRPPSPPLPLGHRSHEPNQVGRRGQSAIDTQEPLLTETDLSVWDVELQIPDTQDQVHRPHTSCDLDQSRSIAPEKQHLSFDTTSSVKTKRDKKKKNRKKGKREEKESKRSIGQREGIKHPGLYPREPCEESTNERKQEKSGKDDELSAADLIKRKKKPSDKKLITFKAPNSPKENPEGRRQRSTSLVSGTFEDFLLKISKLIPLTTRLYPSEFQTDSMWSSTGHEVSDCPPKFVPILTSFHYQLVLQQKLLKKGRLFYPQHLETCPHTRKKGFFSTENQERKG